MIPPTNPKKKSLMPSGELRRSLRGHGHALSPLVQVGKAGVTEGVVKQVTQALADHELIKIKVAAESPADRFAVAARLAEEPGVNIVQILGHIVLAYKRHPKTPRFEGKRARPTAEPEADTSAAKGKGKRTGKAGAAARKKNRHV
jgi:RNA-binding protein